MPGADDWMRLIPGMNPGMPSGMPPPQGMPQQMPQQMPAQPQQSGWRGLLGNRDLAMALLANSGYSPQKRSFGEIMGTSMMQAQQLGHERDDAAFKRKYMEAQMAAMGGKQNLGPSSVQEYEYARKNGYKGSFQEWTVAAGQSSRPSSVLEWEHFNALSPQEKRSYLEMKRNPNWKVGEVDQVPTVIQGGPGGSVQTTALSTLPRTAAAAETVKQSEAQGTRLGTAVGDIAGGIQTKGANAKTAIGMLDDAEKLIDDATGSLFGAGADAAARSVGASTKGDKAIAQLKVLQAGLMLNMPRMEGPQSDRDVQLYREAAASLGDPMVPGDLKKAAVKQIREIQNRYVERAQGAAAGASTQPTLDDIRKKYGR
jgi:hypothetical protein